MVAITEDLVVFLGSVIDPVRYPSYSQPERFTRRYF
jgi:hypothetical protein